MRALWLNRFGYGGNTESVAELAGGLLKKGLKVHLVLNGVPPSLTGAYQEYLYKKGLKSSVNISTQQIQNILYYQSCKLLHVFHPAFFPLAQNLSSSLKINWVASCLEWMDHSAYSTLAGATFITCSSTALWNEIKSIFHPYKKEKVMLIPPGIKITPAELNQPKKLRLLYTGPLEGNRLTVFFRLKKLIAGLKDCDFGVISAH
ncbi:MAG: glycosyltransferase family 4 protein, partial [Firmicutes bacterium]|nr:glycosyltransferase family 4 protein [Bacillota bacterium]